MSSKRKKQQGHYCWVCGRRRANEKFSGKGHAQHICRDCMSERRQQRRAAKRAKKQRQEEEGASE